MAQCDDRDREGDRARRTDGSGSEGTVDHAVVSDPVHGVETSCVPVGIDLLKVSTIKRRAAWVGLLDKLVERQLDVNEGPCTVETERRGYTRAGKRRCYTKCGDLHLVRLMPWWAGGEMGKRWRRGQCKTDDSRHRRQVARRGQCTVSHVLHNLLCGSISKGRFGIRE